LKRSLSDGPSGMGYPGTDIGGLAILEKIADATAKTGDHVASAQSIPFMKLPRSSVPGRSEQAR
jgi:hypothetical protein